MPRELIRAPFSLLLLGLLAACGGIDANGVDVMDGEELGTSNAAMCSNSTASGLNISGISTYQGEMAGAGDWQVTYPANAVWLDYYIDNVKQSSEQRLSETRSGSWSFSKSGVSCGTHTFKVIAYPMVTYSSGSSVCWSNTSQTRTQVVSEPCPSYCGDGVWNGGEDEWSCSYDCGYCGDGTCNPSRGEDRWSCSMDCGGGCYNYAFPPYQYCQLEP
ncbi:MAG TPA: hypothetical protein VEU33_33755 [Archangium sp.]|nr:hypothetical protein [Archangium sp.]